MRFLSGWHVLISEETATQPLVSVLLSTWSKIDWEGAGLFELTVFNPS